MWWVWVFHKPYQISTNFNRWLHLQCAMKCYCSFCANIIYGIPCIASTIFWMCEWYEMLSSIGHSIQNISGNNANESRVDHYHNQVHRVSNVMTDKKLSRDLILIFQCIFQYSGITIAHFIAKYCRCVWNLNRWTIIKWLFGFALYSICLLIIGII